MGVDSLDVRVFWPSTSGSVDPGWSPDTAFVNKFLQGGDATYTGPADSGGIHSHTADEHTHTGVAHTHSVSSAAVAPAATTVLMEDVNRGFDRVSLDDPPIQHSHSSSTSSAATITYQNETITINTTDAQPPYRTMVVIKPDLVTEDVPDDAVCFTDETPTGDGLPTGFTKYAALDNRFVRGADLGGVDDGVATHTHASPAHDHDDDIHSHVGATSGQATPTFQVGTGSPQSTGRPVAHHTVSLLGANSAVDTAAVTVDAVSSEPAYIKLLGIRNTSGAATTPVGIIAAFIGDADDIPSNWQLCNGVGDTLDCTDKQIKSTGTDGDVGDTGGSDTHTHTTAVHSHVHPAAHNHTATQTTILTKSRKNVTPTKNTVSSGVSHAHFWTVGTTTANTQTTAATMSTDDGRSAYRTVVWIKRMIERPGPKQLLTTTF